MENQGKYYIYYHIDPRGGFPKYIGKGSGGRAWEFNPKRRSAKHKNWIKGLKKINLEPLVVVGNRFESEKECFNAEILEIALFRKLGISIKNMANGGQGCSLDKKTIEKRAEKFKKPILCVTTGISYDSTIECSRSLGIQTKRINDVLKARKKSYKGLQFAYLDENLNKQPNLLREKAKAWRKHSNGNQFECFETGKIYPSARALALEVGVSDAYICKKIKIESIISIKEKKYRKT